MKPDLCGRPAAYEQVARFLDRGAMSQSREAQDRPPAAAI
jgi:hypothetical protein